MPDDGPADPANAVQTLVSRLRRALPRGEAVQSGPGGYWLDLPPDAVDAVQFERLAREGRLALRAGEAAVAARQLREALGLRRGEALAGLADAPFTAGAIVRLGELRLVATEDRIEADLQVSRKRSHLVAGLRALTAVHPLRERLRHLLLRALAADGREPRAAEDGRGGVGTHGDGVLLSLGQSGVERPDGRCRACDDARGRSIPARAVVLPNRLTRPQASIA